VRWQPSLILCRRRARIERRSQTVPRPSRVRVRRLARPSASAGNRSASADRPAHRCNLDGRRLRQCGDCDFGRCRSDLVGAPAVRKDERSPAALAGQHRSQFGPFPACRAADFYDHRSFSAAKNRESGAVRGRCRDRDRFSAGRDIGSDPVSEVTTRLAQSVHRKGDDRRPRDAQAGGVHIVDTGAPVPQA
jgi:hypothetical protein